jgi:hypothetical protein
VFQVKRNNLELNHNHSKVEILSAITKYTIPTIPEEHAIKTMIKSTNGTIAPRNITRTLRQEFPDNLLDEKRIQYIKREAKIQDIGSLSDMQYFCKLLIGHTHVQLGEQIHTTADVG